jgi:hypothetical protein
MAPLAQLPEPAGLAWASRKHSPRATCRRQWMPIKGNRPGTISSPHNRRDTRYRPGRIAPPVPGRCSRSTGRPLRSSTGSAGHDLQSRLHRSYVEQFFIESGVGWNHWGYFFPRWRSEFGLSLFDLSHNVLRLNVSWITRAWAGDVWRPHGCARRRRKSCSEVLWVADRKIASEGTRRFGGACI